MLELLKKLMAKGDAVNMYLIGEPEELTRLTPKAVRWDGEKFIFWVLLPGRLHREVGFPVDDIIHIY